MKWLPKNHLNRQLTVTLYFFAGFAWTPCAGIKNPNHKYLYPTFLFNPFFSFHPTANSTDLEPEFQHAFHLILSHLCEFGADDEQNACVFLCFEIEQNVNTSKPKGKMFVQMKLRGARALTAFHIYLIYCLKKEPKTRSEKEKRIAFILTYAFIFHFERILLKKRRKKPKKYAGNEKSAGWLLAIASIYLFTFFCSLPLPFPLTFVIIFVFVDFLNSIRLLMRWFSWLTMAQRKYVMCLCACSLLIIHDGFGKIRFTRKCHALKRCIDLAYTSSRESSRNKNRTKSRNITANDDGNE